MLQRRVTVLLRNWCSWRHFELLLAFADCVSGLYFTGAGSATLLSGFPSAGVCLLFWGASGFIASKGLFNADMRGSTFPLLVCTAIDLTASIWIFFWHPSAKKTFWRWMRDSDRPWVLGVFVPLPPLQYADLFGNAVGALGLANLVMFVRNLTCTMKQASRQESWSRFCIRTVGKLAGQLIAFGIVCFATVGLHNGYVLMDDTNTMPMVRLVSKTTQLKLPTCLRSLGLWTSQEVSLQIHEDTFVPHMVMRRFLPAYKFHPLTFDLEAQSPKLVVFSRMEELLPGLPKYVLLAYCEDFTLVPAWGAHHRYACGAPRLQSAVEMKTFVPGLTLIGADPIYGVIPTHDRINGYPIFNQSLLIWHQLGRPSNVSILCAAVHCELLRKMPHAPAIVEYNQWTQHLGYHFQRAVIPMFLGETGSKALDMYPPTSYIASQMEVDSTVTSDESPYMIFVTRALQRSRKIPPHLLGELLRRLNATVSKAGFQLHIFRKPSGDEGDQNRARDAALFRGASAVIGWHGGALVNLVFCRPNTVVIEGHYGGGMDARLHYVSMSLSVGLRYVAYVPSAPEAQQNLYDSPPFMEWFNVTEFHLFIQYTLRETGLLHFI